MPAVLCIKILRTFSSAAQMLLCYKSEMSIECVVKDGKCSVFIM